MQSISYFPAGLMISPGGLSAGDVKAVASRLEAARKEVLDDARLWADGGPVPPHKEPLDAGFIELPERLLTELSEKKGASELARVRAVADRLAAAVDRVVVLGIGGSYMGARALMEACCHPYHNELGRDQRRGRPRMYFEGNNVDNDAMLGLMDILGNGHEAGTIDSRWAIVVISKSGGTLETAVAFRLLLPLLEKSLAHDSIKMGDLVVPITGHSGKLFELAQAIGCRDRFDVPDGIGGRFSVLSAVGLLPAAILGLDVRLLVEGAAEMNRHFRTAPIGENVVLDYVVACHLMETERGCDVRVLSTWGKRLEAVGFWYDQLLAESLGKEERGALPLTVVNTRDLHSRGQQHQEGKRDKLITNLIVGTPQRQPLAVPKSERNQDELNQFAGKSMPELLVAAILGTNQAYREDHRPTADLHLTQLDEYSLGQFFQLMMLATAVEGRLIGINPFGQPGVEAYKRNMNAILKEGD